MSCRFLCSLRIRQNWDKRPVRFYCLLEAHVGLRIRCLSQVWPHGLKAYTFCIRVSFSPSSNSNSSSIACWPNLAEQVHVLRSDLWMEADVHRDPQLAEWPGDDTERPGDNTATGDEVLEIVCRCVPIIHNVQATNSLCKAQPSAVDLSFTLN